MLVTFLLIIQAMAYAIVRSVWPPMKRIGATLAFAIMAVLSIMFREFTNVLVCNILGGIWLVSCALCIVFSLPVFIWRALERAQTKPVDVGRRQFLRGAGLPAAALSVSTVGNLNGLREFDVRHEDVVLPGLPKALDGFRIGQITDTHVGPFIAPEDLQRAIASLDAAEVHLVAMTGDLIDDLTRLPESLDALAQSRALHGVLCILGNHEKWHGLGAVLQGYKESAKRNSNLRLLVDQNVRIEHNGATLRVVGVDYPMSAGGGRRAALENREAMMQQSAARAFADVHPDDALICLSHHPDFFPIAADHGARLTLAGHTHGGQVGFFRRPLFTFAFKYMLGRYKRGGAHLYVSAGTGHWLPFRMGVPAEVTVLTLRAGS